MKNVRYIHLLFMTTILQSLFIASCTTRVGKVRIAYDDSVPPIKLKGKTVQSFNANYKKHLSKEDAFKTAKLLTAASGTSLDFSTITGRESGLIVLQSKEDPSALFEMDTSSGNFLYNAGLAEYKKPGNTPNLITGQRAEAAALRHLEKLGLSPEKKELRLAHIGGVNMAELREDGSTKTYDKLVTVRYDRTLSGLVVMGESRIVVQMGADGKLAGLILNWPEVRTVGEIKADRLLSDKDIKATLEKRLKEIKGVKRVVVEKADLVLYDDGKGQIEPAYFVEARLYYEAPDTETGTIQKYDVPYDYYVPVLKKPRAFYPYMEKAAVKPYDARKVRVKPKDDE